MFDPAIAAILAHHETKSGHTMMRAAAQRAEQLGYALVPPAKGDGKYLRLIFEPGKGTPVTLYLEGGRMNAGAKHLRRFAASLPGAVTKTRLVEFPLGPVAISTLEAFADWASTAKRAGSSTLLRSAGASAEPSAPAAAPMHAPAPRAKPRPPWERTSSPSPAPPPGLKSPLPPAPAPWRGPPPAAPRHGMPPAAAAGPRATPVLLVAAVALLLLLGVLLVGVDGALIMSGLAVIGVGVVAAIRGQARWAHIASRGVGSAVAAGGLALFVAGGALTPTQPSTQSNTAPPAATSAEGASPSPSELDIAAAEAALARAETRENPVTPDALVSNPTSGVLGDEGTTAAIDRAAPTSALAALAALEVKGRAPKTGYDRDLFGSGWGDPDRNGCDTRNDILARDLSGETFKPGTRNCVVLTGGLADPYSGRAIAFQRGQTTSDDVQIDHVVAVSDAWQKGAQAWDAGRRIAFYNDPLNLLAVDGPLNMQKGDGDAATWLPPNRSYRCAYVARQVAVKVSYGLWMTQAEKNAIATILSVCPNEPLPGGVVAVLAVPEAAPEPAPQPAPQSESAPEPAAPVVPVPVPRAPAPVPAPAPAPVPAPAPAGNPGDSKNCSDFATRAQAQNWYNTYFPQYGDVARLDGNDNDGLACESLP